jgi:hypothetical protein
VSLLAVSFIGFGTSAAWAYDSGISTPALGWAFEDSAKTLNRFEHRGARAQISVESAGRSSGHQVRSRNALEARTSWGILSPKIKLYHVSERDEFDPRLQEDIESQARVTLNLGVPELPTLTIGLERETSRSESRSDGKVFEHELSDRVLAGLWYGRSSWEVYASAGRSRRVNPLNSASDATAVEYSLGASFRPFSTLTIAPTVDVSLWELEAGGERSESLGGGIQVNYTGLDSGVTVSVDSWYSIDRDDAGWYDSRSLDVSFGIQKDLSPSLHLPYRHQSVGLELVYSSSEDHVDEDADKSDVRALLLFRFEY